MLKIRNLYHEYKDGSKKKVVLNDIDCDFENGKIYAIMGPSGSGKTTLLSIISGLDNPLKGEIYLDDKKVDDKNLLDYRKIDISIVFQAYNLIDYMTGLENVVTAMEISGDTKNKVNIAKNVLNSLEIVGENINRPVNTLSGGEAQRVAIARSIAVNSKIIFADEPTGNLDENTEKEIIDIFKNLAHNKNKCVIIVTHSKEVANNADVIYILKDKKLVKKLQV
ncbi:MAG: ABC transporter ATP-binding protein [Bacilli bacterium]